MAQDDRRSRKRVPYHVEIKYAFDQEWQEAHSFNVSMNGMLIGLKEMIPVGEQGRVRILQDFGNEEVLVSALVEVVRAQPGISKDIPYEIAVRFTEMDFDSSVNLFNVVRDMSGDDWRMQN